MKILFTWLFILTFQNTFRVKSEHSNKDGGVSNVLEIQFNFTEELTLYVFVQIPQSESDRSSGNRFVDTVKECLMVSQLLFFGCPLEPLCA